MVGREKEKERSEHHLKSMKLIKSHMKSGLANTIKRKKKNLIASLTDTNSNKEREVQDVGHEDIHVL